MDIKRTYCFIATICILFAGCNYSLKKSYYPDGHLREITGMKDGKLDGKYFLFYENGNLRKHGYFKLGKATGHWVNYFSNNRIRNEAYLKNGMMDSIEKSYDSVTGKLVREAYYKDSILNGLYKEFFPDGKLSFRASFKEGKPDDTCTAFYENGKLEYAGKFKDGKKEGTFIKWYPNGRMKMVIGYRDDIQVLSKVCFDEDGRLIPSYGMILRKNTKDTIALEESFKVDIGDINYDPSKPIT